MTLVQYLEQDEAGVSRERTAQNGSPHADKFSQTLRSRILYLNLVSKVINQVKSREKNEQNKIKTKTGFKKQKTFCPTVFKYFGLHWCFCPWSWTYAISRISATFGMILTNFSENVSCFMTRLEACLLRVIFKCWFYKTSHITF